MVTIRTTSFNKPADDVFRHVSRYTRKCHLIYAHNKSTNFLDLIFMKLINDQLHSRKTLIIRTFIYLGQ
jgi:hypothetical protein